MKPYHLTLFLFKRDFKDGDEQQYFCPYCLRIEGLMAMFPEIRQGVYVKYVDFQKPREALVELLGEGNQSCPRLVTQGEFDFGQNHSFEFVHEGIYQLSSTDDIIAFFIDYFGLPKIHP
jgi:glutaredoxin